MRGQTTFESRYQRDSTYEIVAAAALPNRVGLSLRLDALSHRVEMKSLGENEDCLCQRPAGTIALQAPFFRAAGIDLSQYFPGTLNVDLAPHVPPAPQPVFDARLRWFGALEERFLLTPIALRHAGVVHEGLWYYPHPETKPAHFQRPTVVELLLPWVPGLGEGGQVDVGLPPAHP